MLRKFKIRHMVPPGGRYFYRPPETNVDFSYPTREGLLTALRAHYSANSIAPPPNLPELVEDYICRHVSPGFCTGEGTAAFGRVVSLRDIRENTQKLLAGGLASPGEAARRVDICLACEYNDRRMCPSCVGLVAWAQRLVNRSLPRDAWLGVCGVDASALPAKVHMNSVPANADYPGNCWVGKA